MEQESIPITAENIQNRSAAFISTAAGEAGNQLQLICHELACRAGWWIDTETDTPILQAAGRWAPYVVATKLALAHSEISEALEGARKNLTDDHLTDRPMLEVELADALIRICDLAGALGLDLGGAIAAKLAYNQQRVDHKPENRLKQNGKTY